MHGNISSQERDVSQARAAPRSGKSFANETAEQRCQHREIAWRYRQRKRRHHPKIYVRIRELERTFLDFYGPRLPDDDAGLDSIYVMANHLAHLTKPGSADQGMGAALGTMARNEPDRRACRHGAAATHEMERRRA